MDKSRIIDPCIDIGRVKIFSDDLDICRIALLTRCVDEIRSSERVAVQKIEVVKQFVLIDLVSLFEPDRMRVPLFGEVFIP